MKIIQILPGLEEGGVERHVLWLSNELASRGHEILVISSGGKLEGQFEPSVKHWKLPVHVKNPVTGAWCAARIAWRAKREKWHVLHAHSRVPIWIAWWANALVKMPWIFTAHDVYRHNLALKPFTRAQGAICGSETIRKHLEGFLPPNSKVFLNGIPNVSISWRGGGNIPFRFLFIGRITKRKGLHVVLRAFEKLADKEWLLDVIGDGPKRHEMESLCEDVRIADKVHFHGYRNDIDQWLADCDCFVFPSLEEGMGLTLMQAVKMHVPTLASNLSPIRELACDDAVLPSAGDVKSWESALRKVLNDGPPLGGFQTEKVSTISEMTDKVIAYYKEVVQD